MPTNFLAPSQDFLQTTLNGAITDSATTITLNSAANVVAPGYAVIDRQNSAGTNTPNSREVISYTGVSGSDLTGVTRGANNSTARSHLDGAIVEFSPTVGMWNNLATIVGTGFTNDSYLKAIPSPVTIGRLEATNLIAASASITTLFIKTNIQASGASVVGIAVSDPLITNALQVASIASINQLHVATNINASGASIVGIMPSGASGSVLVSRGNTVIPVFGTVPRVKASSLTRDAATASGNVAYTGVGFKPTAVVFLSIVDSTTRMSVGIDDATSSFGVPFLGTNFGESATNAIYQYVSAGNTHVGEIATMDADGFTITWTKAGTPTGVFTVYYLAIG